MGHGSPLIKAIAEDFQKRHPQYHKSRREGLASLAGVMLETRSANLMELAAALPREIGTAHDRYQYIDHASRESTFKAADSRGARSVSGS